jgi:hypothetical protein
MSEMKLSTVIVHISAAALNLRSKAARERPTDNWRRSSIPNVDAGNETAAGTVVILYQ